VDARFNPFQGILMVMLLFLVIASVIAVTQAQRKVPVQYAQRAVGRKIVSGGTSFMPLRVNYAGVMPIIFAQAILMFPQKILKIAGDTYRLPFLSTFANKLVEGATLYMVLYGAMILFFSYFWVATQFNEIQIADDLKKAGGYIPGVRPGQATSDFLHNAMSRITLAGAVFLTILATIPILLNRAMNVPFPVATFFGGTSILIMVGVMLGFPKFPVTSNEYGPLAAAGFSSVSQLESTPKKYVPGVRLLTVSVSACPSKGVSAPSTHELNWVQVLMT